MLIDCLVYIALLALILGLAFAAFYRTTEHSTRLEHNATDIMRALRAGERWREDVRSANATPQVVSNAEAVTLRIPRGKGDIAYVFSGGVVRREESPGGQREELLSSVRTSEFHRDPRQHVTAWRWELELQGKQKVARVKPLFTFQTVVRAEVKP
jgi:hypothetical protein